MSNFEILVLSLPDAIHRRENFHKNFNSVSKLNYKFFDGVYGKNLEQKKIDEIYSSAKANFKIGRDLTLGEIGATYSHYLMYKQALQKECDYLIVLEDDSFLNPNFDVVLKSILSEFKYTDDAIIFIQEHTLNNKVIFSKNSTCVHGEYTVSRMLGSSQYFVGSYGYIITKEALHKIVKNYLPLYCVCDHWYFIKKQSAIKYFYALKPSIVRTNEEHVREIDSFINEERKQILIKNELTNLAKLKIFTKKILLPVLNKDWE
ncbi:glycosyltransferase family 25 protein [Enterobacter sp. PTB]|uniref:glycosyltransferase family 25 protein n=1 Tax=Enterobacter sp. PTB TaxID=3143437 RepID=UPI003DA8BA16